MIQEAIVTSQSDTGHVHIAPMGIHVLDNQYIILPFRPSKTLDNILHTQAAVINYCDDVRIFAGCLTGRRDWPMQKTEKINGLYLSHALTHVELGLTGVEDDLVRPKLFCQPVHTVSHAPFKGFNRGQYAVLEAAILVSRLGMLPMSKIQTEIDYLRIGLEKTGGEREVEAWQWLMQVIESYQQENPA